jgi:hypothetical protein
MIRIESSQNLPVSGPSNLIATLLKMGLTNQATNSFFLAEMDASRNLIALTPLNELNLVTPSADTAFGVFILLSATDDFDSQAVRMDIESLNQAESGGAFALDRLLIGPTKWKSTICHDYKCCPAEGKPRVLEMDLSNQQQFDYLAQTSELLGEIDVIAMAYLENIQVRDAWLVYLTEPSHTYRIKNWLNIFEVTRKNPDSTFVGIAESRFLTLHSILHYLNDEIAISKELIELATAASNEYSLTRLIQRAHHTSAPRELIAQAFQAVTYEKLNIFPDK